MDLFQKEWYGVSTYCRSTGAPLFLRSLDADGAFDAIPHPVLLDCASSLLPDHCWRIHYNWYSDMSVNVKWRSQLGLSINIQRDTRQGGLTSAKLFYLFYQKLITKISECTFGVVIQGHQYNVFCYAHDLLLASTTVTGLQAFIALAVSHVNDRGLRFNPEKTTCMTYGPNPFTTLPKWNIDGVTLPVEENTKYLGAILDQSDGLTHARLRTSKGNQAFYSLQGAGLYRHCIHPNSAFHIYGTAVRIGLVYGCESIYMNKKSLKLLDTAKHLKAILGLNSFTQKPLLKAIGIDFISNSVLISSLELFRMNILSSSAKSDFYKFNNMLMAF